MKIRTVLGIGACLCATAVFGPPRTDIRADEGGKTKLIGSAKDVSKLIGEDSAELKKALSAAKPSKKDLKRARLLAIVVAMNAEALGENGAAQREQAVKVAEALAKGDEGIADAKSAAAALTTAKSPGGGTVSDPVKTMMDEDTKDWDRELAMQLFKASSAGGLGIEAKFKYWLNTKPPTEKDMDIAASFAQKSAVVGMILQRMAAPKDKGITPDDWKKFSANLTSSAEDAMKAAKGRDAKATLAAIGRVDQACTACHDKVGR